MKTADPICLVLTDDSDSLPPYRDCEVYLSDWKDKNLKLFISIGKNGPFWNLVCDQMNHPVGEGFVAQDDYVYRFWFQNHKEWQRHQSEIEKTKESLQIKSQKEMRRPSP